MTVFTLSDADDDFPAVGQDNSGNDSITALGGNDAVSAGTGNDTVLGGFGDDSLTGGLGDDWLVGNFGNDLVYGGAGNDAVEGEICYGGQGDDVLVAGFNGDIQRALLYGGDGNDTLFQFSDRDTIWGGDGDDFVQARFSPLLPDVDCELHGQSGNDMLDFWVTRGNGQVDVADFSLTISEATWTLVLNGDSVGIVDGFEAQHAQIIADHVTLQGSAGNDLVAIEADTAIVALGGGNDTLVFQTIRDHLGQFQIDGGDGKDLIEFNLDRHLSGSFVLDARQAVTTLSVSGGEASAIEGVETWHVTGARYNDLAYLGGGNDIVVEVKGRASGSDTFFGGGGNDSLNGGRDDDVLSGDNGRDTVLGGAGNDTITGGLGRDYLAGGVGQDVLVFNTLADSGTVFGHGLIDNVTYFQVDATAGSSSYIDRIDLSAIDAQAGVAGDQAFSFIGTAAFTAEGQVRVTQSGTGTFVQVNAIGSSGSEMTICLLDVTAAHIGVEDFIL